jgi:hypothetical protein
VDVPLDKAEAIRWYRRAFSLGSPMSAINLGLCFERGEGVEVDLTQSAKFYQFAADRGDASAILNVGFFHWSGLGGLRADTAEAIRLWLLAGLEVPESLAAVCPPIEFDSERLPAASPRLDEWILAECRQANQLSGDRLRRFEWVHAFKAVAVGAGPAADASFELWNTDRLRAVEAAALPDGRLVAGFLRSGPSVAEIGRLAGSEIRREGSRRIGRPSDAIEGVDLSAKLCACEDILSLLRVCAHLYMQATFLYRRVNHLLRS